MFNKILIFLWVSFVLSVPLAVYAADETYFVAMFEKFNEARKTAEIGTLTRLLVNDEAQEIEECIGNTICGEHLIKNLKQDALISYKLTNFVKFDSSGPAAKFYYIGEKVRGDKGQGVVTFAQEEGEWKISIMSWKKIE